MRLKMRAKQTVTISEESGSSTGDSPNLLSLLGGEHRAEASSVPESQKSPSPREYKMKKYALCSSTIHQSMIHLTIAEASVRREVGS